MQKITSKRILDLIVVFLALPLITPISVFTFITIKLTSTGNALYWSQRVGFNNQLFSMPKFRTMRVDTPAVATHLLPNPEQFLTPVGSFLRRTSLDELPQLWSVLKGDMSLVGPRPALFNQDDLMALRVEHGVDKLLPGLTGWAQVNGRDDLAIAEKVKLDIEYMKNQSIWLDMKIIGITVLKVLGRDGVKH